MVGFGEGGEQEKTDYSTIASQNDKEQGISALAEQSGSKASPLAVLQQELHILANNSVPSGESEQNQQVATRENVYGEHGTITDVLFHQNGKSVNLKRLLPGTYTIEITHDEQARSEADEEENKITVNDSPQESSRNEFNLALLHEAGHMVDNRSNKDTYQLSKKDVTIAKLKGGLLYSKLLDVSDGKNLVPQTLIWAQKLIEAERANFTPEQLEEITKAVGETSQYVTEAHPAEEIAQMKDAQDMLKKNIYTKRSVQKERNAWANALHALRELKRQGITVFAGTKQELFQTIDRALGTYEFFDGENLLPTDRHFIKSSLSTE
jgi:hypothetical protein